MKQGRVMLFEHCTSSQKSLSLCEVYIKSLQYVSSYIHIQDKNVEDGCLSKFTMWVFFLLLSKISKTP
jgi:hypothetical protein